MSNIIWIISTVLIFTILSAVFRELYSNKKHIPEDMSKSNIIKPNKICFIVGVSGGILFLIGTILAWFLDKTTTNTYKIIYCCILIVFAACLYGYLLFFYLNYKIVVYEDYFIYQNFWRIKKTIYYKDVEINKTKLYPQVRQKQNNGKTKLVFKLAGILVNEDAFMVAYKNWKSKQKSKDN